MKRVKVTKTGKIMRRGSHIRHLRLKKSKKTVRRQKLMREVKGKIGKKVRKLISK